jgi:hypothetical protein
VIRNVVLGRLHPDADRGLLAAGLEGIAALRTEGLLDVRVGRDAGLRDGNWDYAITADFADAEAYGRYDLDDEHNRLRRDHLAPVSAEVARLQFEL